MGWGWGSDTWPKSSHLTKDKKYGREEGGGSRERVGGVLGTQGVKESTLRKEKEGKAKSHFPEYLIKSSRFSNLRRGSRISYCPMGRDSGKERYNISLKD